jgi:hypothetical protein
MTKNKKKTVNRMVIIVKNIDPHCIFDHQAVATAVQAAEKKAYDRARRKHTFDAELATRGKKGVIELLSNVIHEGMIFSVSEMSRLPIFKSKDNITLRQIYDEFTDEILRLINNGY